MVAGKAYAMPHTMMPECRLHAVRRRPGTVTCAVVAACFGGTRRQRDCAGDEEEGRDKFFLLHHHSTGYWVNETRARSGRPATSISTFPGSRLEPIRA